MNETLLDIASVVPRWRVWYLMGGQDIQMRYRRSLIGPFWISLTMCVLVLALSYMYSEILHQEFRNYMSYLAPGICAWNLISALLNEGAGCVIENERSLRSAPVPLSLLAGRIVFRNALIFAHNLAAIVILIAALGVPVTWTGLLVAPGLALIFVIGLFWALILGPLCARFRDVPQILANVTQVMFFLTPIMWRPSMAPRRPALIEYNPFHHLIELVRAPLLGHSPSAYDWAFSLVFAACMGAAALVSLAWARRKIFLWL